jgi:hypothetical protein
MKKRVSKHILPLMAVIPGSIGLLLRLALYTRREMGGLLPQAHPLHIATVILSFITAGLTLILIRNAETSERSNRASSVASAGAFFAGLWLLPVAFEILSQARGILDLLHAGLGFLAVPCLIYTAWCHYKNRRPHFLIYGAICLFFSLHMVCQYRLWSSSPQIPDYLLPVFACVFLSLAAYYRAARDLDMSNWRSLLFCAVMAGFFCICSMAGEGDRRYYLAGALWSLTDWLVLEDSKPEENHHVSA